MDNFSRMSRGRFYLALTYLVWSLLPHFHILIHSHAGDSHFHAAYSATEVETANRVLETLASESGNSEQSAGFGGIHKPDTRYSAGSATGGISRPQSGSELHGHFLEDPNLAGLASPIQSISPSSVLAPSNPRSYQDPSVRAVRPASARGPPAFLPA